MPIEMIEVNQLDHSPDNARRTTSGTAAEDLQASILAHGLMQNLVVAVAEGGRYHVIAGNRRLDAIRSLQKAGKLAAGHAVACQVVASGNALELSLAENTVRQAMHPADEFEAFARLIADGQTVALAAERFGVSERHVEQRLKLGRLAPELVAAYRAGHLTLDALMAFTITDDQAKQMRVYDALHPWQTDDAREIRAILTGEMAEASSKLAVFVGLEAYYAAGGETRSDLFGEDVYLEDAELLHRLAAEKLAAIGKQLEAEGWGWVEINPEQDWGFACRHRHLDAHPVNVPQGVFDRKSQLEAELEAIELALEESESAEMIEAAEDVEKRLAAIEEEIESFAAYEPEEMRYAGCYVSIDRDGSLSIEKGLVRRQDERLARPGEGRRSPKADSGMPESLRRDLEAFRQQAAQVEIARNRLVALDLLVFTASRSVLRRDAAEAIDVEFRGQRPAVKEPTRAASELETIKQGLPVDWLDHASEWEQFQAFTGLTDTKKLDLLAYCVASSLKPQLATGNEDTAYELALSLTDARMEAYWRPTRANYFGRVTRDRLLAVGGELLGDQWSQARSRDKKGELADALDRMFAEPEKFARTPQQLEMLTGWLPAGMAFARPGNALETPEVMDDPKAA